MTIVGGAGTIPSAAAEALQQQDRSAEASSAGGAHQANAEQRRTQIDRAARDFEGIFIRQLLSVLRRTAPNGGNMGEMAGNDTYVSMMDEAFAGALSRGDGIGLRETLARTMGATPEDLAHFATHTTTGTSSTLSLEGVGVAPQELGRGLTADLASAASRMVQGTTAQHWSREGTLDTQDLASPLATPTANGGEARFNVRDALGFQGYRKCNLFAFEVARRAGMQVPVIARERGWGFPSPNAVTADASDGSLRGGWARVATGQRAEALDAAITRGERAFLLTASGIEGHSGHMGVVERIREIEYGQDGGMRRIVFDGWEAREHGAQHVTNRSWNVYGSPGEADEDVRNGLQRIELLELVRATDGNHEEIPLSSRATPSLHDAPKVR